MSEQLSIKPKNMKFFEKILILSQISAAQVSLTYCNAVREFLFPDAEKCKDEDLCSGYKACVVTPDCSRHECVSGPACPKGTTYSAFSPQIASNNGYEMATSSLAGYYCAKDGLECGFDDEGFFYIDAIVENREAWNGLGTPDYRNVSMISKSKFDAHDGGAFKQFSTSACLGEPIEAGDKLLFHKTTRDSDCKKEMDYSSQFSEDNGLLYIIDFYIGNKLTCISKF